MKMPFYIKCQEYSKNISEKKQVLPFSEHYGQMLPGVTCLRWLFPKLGKHATLKKTSCTLGGRDRVSKFWALGFPWEIFI